ncbi:EpsG family protein, partial [Vagococcus bubulae]
IIGLDYFNLILFIALIFCIFLYKYIKRYSVNPSIVLVFYIFFPFFLDIVQIRNSIAMLLILYGVGLLSEKKYLRYVVLVLIATSFHNTSIFYLSFLLVCINNKQNLIRLVLLIVSVSFLFKDAIINFIVRIIPLGSKYIRYLEGSKPSTVVLFIFFFMLNIFIINMMVTGIIKYNENWNYLSESQIQFVEVVYKINIIIFLSFMFISMDVDFFRLYRNIIIMNYILFSNTFYNRKTLLCPELNISQILFFIFSLAIGFAFLYNNQFNHVVIQIIKSVQL